MAQIKLLKISVDGIPVENALTDDLTLNSFTAGSGPIVSPSGVSMTNTSITALQNITFTDPSVDTINQTSGVLVVNNIMAKERDNVMATTGSVIFPLITDTPGTVDAFKLPSIAGPPTSTPAFSTAAGYEVFDATNGDPYVWNGTTWVNLNLVKSAQHVIFAGGNAGTGGNAARDVVYYSAADTLLPANAAATATSYAVGFATAAALVGAPVMVQQNGTLTGFTGLTAGARYYLSPATAGAVTATLPTGSGNTIVLCGIAKNTTDMCIRIQDLGRRA